MSIASDANCAEETRRSASLHSYEILDTPREEDFDDLAKIAADVCGTPIAIVNLIDTHRQFFKAEVGVGDRPTPPLDLAFCGHALLEENFLMVTDAASDPRFACNPLVTADPKLRFYAGAVIKTQEGLPLGTVCVFDVVPRQLDTPQIRTLNLLARQAMVQMELRRSLGAQARLLGEVRASEARHRQIIDSAIDFAVITLDLGGNVTSWSVGAERILGWSEKELLGKPADIFFTPEDRENGISGKEMQAAREEGRGIDERWHLRRSGERFWASGEMMPLKDDVERHIGYVKILRDRTEQRKGELQREELTRELAHRMKNMLAMVQAIATQTFRTAKSLEEGRDAISSRLIALSRAQDILTESGTNTNEIGHLVEEALRPHRSGEGRISVAGPTIELNPDQGLGLSLAIHELATNAVKYGALSSADGKVAVSWTISADRSFTFCWQEHGGPVVVAPTTRGFGTRLIERIVSPYFDGTGKLTFDPSGVRFDMTGNTAPSGVR